VWFTACRKSVKHCYSCTAGFFHSHRSVFYCAFLKHFQHQCLTQGDGFVHRWYRFLSGAKCVTDFQKGQLFLPSLANLANQEAHRLIMVSNLDYCNGILAGQVMWFGSYSVHIMWQLDKFLTKPVCSHQTKQFVNYTGYWSTTWAPGHIRPKTFGPGALYLLCRSEDTLQKWPKNVYRYSCEAVWYTQSI